VDPSSESGPVLRDVSTLTCESCGRHPALRITVRRHVGLFYLQRFVTVNAVACRSCGRRLVRNFTLRTLAQGWWGVISFFFNWFVLAANAVVWMRLGRLNQPSVAGTEGWSVESDGPLVWDAEPVSRTKSWLVRGGAIVAALFVGLVLVGMVSGLRAAPYHEHREPHGAPMTAREVKRELAGQMFFTTGGARVWVQSSECTGVGEEAVSFVHFDCHVLFSNGRSDDVLRKGLFFKSSAAGGA
jgi:hypothetical protein